MATLRALRWVLLGVTVAATSGVPAACGRRGGGAQGTDTLFIGVAAARVGRTDAYFNGVALAVDHLNAARPVGHRPFGVAWPPLDQPTQVAVAAGFRDDPRVVGVVGHTGSAQTLEAAPIYGDVERGGRRAVVAVTPTATNPAVTRANEWVFRVCPTDDDAARALARYAADSLRARAVAVVYRNDLFGRGFTRTFRDAFAEQGGRVIEHDPYLAGITEYAAYAGRIARRRADAVVIAGGADDAQDMVRALRAATATGAGEAGRAAIPVLGTDDLAALASEPESAREFRGVRYTTFYLPEQALTPERQRFVSDYRRRSGRSPDHRAALSYDAAMLIGQAVLAVGPDRHRVRDWIADVGRRTAAFAGVTGDIRFNADGDAVSKLVLVTEVRP